MKKLPLLMLIACWFAAYPLGAQTVKPRLKITSDTSNWCQQAGQVAWTIYDSAAGNATLSTGIITIPTTAITTAAICYKSIRAELLKVLSDYIASNNILEADGTIVPYNGVYFSTSVLRGGFCVVY